MSDASSKTYYRVDMPKLSVAECWRNAPSLWGFVLSLLYFKLLGKQFPAQYAVARLEAPIADLVERIPPRVRRLAAPLVDEAHKLGFIDCFSYSIQSIGLSETWGRAMRGPDGDVGLLVLFARTGHGNRWLLEEVNFTFHSKSTDGKYLSSVGSKQRHDYPPNIRVKFLPNRSLSEVYRRHRLRLQNERGVERIDNDRALEQVILEISAAAFDFKIQRGVLVPVTDEEAERLRATKVPADVDEPLFEPVKGAPL